MLGTSNAMQQPTHDMKSFQTGAASPRRWGSIAVVIAIHVVAIYALASGLAANLAVKIVQDVKVAVVKEKPPEQKLPPPPPPNLVKPPPQFVPPPEIAIQTPVTQTNAITQVSNKPQPPAPPAPPKPAGITAPVSIGRPHACPSARWYPPVAERLGHEGTTTVGFTVEADGSISNPTILKSSGYDDLDSAAVRCVNSWSAYKPAMQNGTPVAVKTSALIKWVVPR